MVNGSKKAFTVFRMIENHILEYGWPPSFKEICDETQICEKTVKKCMDQMVKENIIKRGRKIRQLVILPQSEWKTL